ncbi:GspE/PulE family protein [Poriferisphaera sp. WC338]|uniref:GspE/PulE family protein n=1 Tax=Poriferisphaera sp. WC338 TaxID=3425129 RepID=UPI003D81A134
MINTFLEVEAVVLMSWFKPLMFLVVLGGWAWVVGHLDKDAAYYYLPRIWTNLFLMVTGLLGLALMLLIPFFFLGFLLGLCPIVGGIGGYAYYRNTKVPEGERWTLNAEMWKEKMAKKAHAKAQYKATLQLVQKDEGLMEVPSGDTPQALAHETLENVLDFAVPRRATQIDIIADAKKAAMVARIDGVKYPQPALEPKAALALIDYVKSSSGLDVEDRRKKQIGALKFQMEEHGKHEMSLVTMGSTRGVSLTMILDDSRAHLPFEKLGLLDAQLEHLKKLTQEEGKVVLVSSPPKMGSTTTLYSLTQVHDPYIQSVVTLEDQEVFEMEGVSHNALPEDMTAEDFNHKLRGVIRTDPNVIMINRLPDASTLAEITDASKDIRFYIGMQANDTFESLKLWIKQVGNKRKAAEMIGGIVTQRLMRRLCETCRTGYQPDPAVLKKMNLPADRVGELYHASGQVVIKDKPQTCPLCHGIGYRGRIAVFEVMPIDMQARQLIAAGDLDKLKSYLRKQKMLWLQEAALANVVSGNTDIKEVTRALSERSGQRKRSSSSSAKKPAAAPSQG